MEKNAKELATWFEEGFPDWETSRHKVQNVHCGGPIRYTTSLLLFLPGEVSRLLGPFDDVDETESMESYLDDSNMRYSDYISAWTTQETKALPEDGVLPLTPVIHSIIEWKTDCL